MSGDKRKSILVVDDDTGQRRILEGFLAGRGYSLRSASDAETALSLLQEEPADLVLMDVRMPGMGGLRGLERSQELTPAPSVILLTAYADVRNAVDAMRRGAVDYLEKPVDLEELATVIGETIGSPRVAEGLELSELPPDLIVASEGMRTAVKEADLVARTDATVLVTGESGTGKEKIAEFIHRRSARGGRRLVRVNCAAIPGNLVESELFGHRKGSFTGADSDRAGRFESAAGGTLLLDEVGELPLDIQPKLLRVLEDGTFDRVGESRTRQAGARVIACTNRDLEREVAAGRFREDLFWRLNVFQIHLPPLRERREEVPLLARRFLARTGRESVRISPAAMRILESHHWPGNVREVANVLERAGILATGGIILPEHLPSGVRGLPSADVPGWEPADDLSVEEAERQAIRRALLETDGNRTRAAKLLGISRRTLLYRLKRYGGAP